MSCLFCSIVAGEIPSKLVYEDDAALAFLDINPWHAGHTLVIPKEHVETVLEDSSILAEIAPAIVATAALLTAKLGADGMNVLSNAGGVSGQEVFHAHVHLIPRYANLPGIAGMSMREDGIDLNEIHARIVN
ncbi:MAG: HIT domain-containing protein [Propionibacteriaceae bacterium]|jgi:histidine triad (HIT) family protein|nr:HIT domain-containing protein [Micropruina sp.]HBX82029.1 HIT family protein [Propionibacteriaceae bacterium]